MKKFLTVVAIAAFAVYLPACKGKLKDADVKTAAEAVIAANPDYKGLVVDVKDGIATVTGEVRDASVQSALKTSLGAVKGVKSIQDNTTIAAPPPPPPVIAADDPLTQGINDALKDFPSVKATVKDGIISVTGETTAANWKKIKIALDALRPKKVDASGLKIK